ncbi:MAG: hypothetical protein NTX50_03815 [Candidatus Sumerlaeota bacterium]|nr:hypothetical protein [Candidatus Sumerlaeota bacterium]
MALAIRRLAGIPGAGARAVFHWLSDHGVDIIAVVGLILSWRNHVYHLEERIDIGLYDETCSLINGVFLKHNPFPNAAFSPFYDVWYFLLSKIVSDNTALYYFNYKIGMLLLAVLAYLCLRAGKVSIVAAFLASSFVLFCQSNLYTWPRVCHFALGVLLAGLALAHASRRKTAFILILALTSLVTSYVRPEFFVPYILLFIYLIYEGARSKRLRSILIPAGGLALAGILAVSILGCPIVDKEKRSFVAFTQHFALNWVRWNSSNLNPWTDASTIRMKCFGQANTVPKCIMANPGLVMRHVLTNARIAPGTLLVGLRPMMPLYDGVLPPKRANGLQWIALMLLATVMARGWSKSRIIANWFPCFFADDSVLPLDIADLSPGPLFAAYTDSDRHHGDDFAADARD